MSPAKDGATRAEPAFPREHLLHFLALWGVLSATSLTLFLAVRQSVWHDPVLPAEVRLGLLCLELAFLAPMALIATVPSALLVLAERRGAQAGADATPRRRPTRAVLWAYVAVLLFLYVSSWMVLRSTGHFLDSVGVRLWVENPTQLLQHVAHMEPLTLLAVPAAVTVMAAALAWGLPRLATGLGRTWSGRIVTGGIVFAFLVVSASLVVFSRHGRLMAMHVAEAGPLVSSGVEVRRLVTTRGDPLHDTPQPEVLRHPIVSVEEYLSGVDRDAAQRWNVIVLIVESLRTDQLRVYGGERDVMPTVDAIGRDGRVFLKHYSQASHSDYADPAVLSSQYPLRSLYYYVYPRRIPYPRVLIYDVLKGLGYRTGVFSSQNENWNGMAHYLRTGNIDRFLHSDTYEGPTYVPYDDPPFYDFVKGTRRAGKIDDRYTVAEAIDWIGEAPERPFFIYMNLQNSHLPYELPEDFAPRFGTGEISFPLRFGVFPADSAPAVKDLYANALAYVDAQIAKLVTHLHERDLWDSTIFVVTGDTGQGFYEHGFAGHGGTPFDEVVRVPLLIRAPGLSAGADARPAQHVDIPPSILDLLRLPSHPGFQGTTLFGEDPEPRRPLFVVGQAVANQYAVVSGRHKLIYDADADGYMLFDLCVDPGETRNLAAGRPDLTRRLGRLLHGWRKVQVDYYGDWEQQRRTYPPVLAGAPGASLPEPEASACAESALHPPGDPVTESTVR